MVLGRFAAKLKLARPKKGEKEGPPGFLVSFVLTDIFRVREVEEGETDKRDRRKESRIEKERERERAESSSLVLPGCLRASLYCSSR